MYISLDLWKGLLSSSIQTHAALFSPVKICQKPKFINVFWGFRLQELMYFVQIGSEKYKKDL